MPRDIYVPAEINDIDSLIRRMIFWSGISGTEVSRRIGRSDNYIWSMLRNGTMPGVDLLAAIAEACGYVVTVRETQGHESWELSVRDGQLVVEEEYGPEHLAEKAQAEDRAFERYADIARIEVVDSLIDHLSDLKAHLLENGTRSSDDDGGAGVPSEKEIAPDLTDIDSPAS